MLTRDATLRLQEAAAHNSIQVFSLVRSVKPLDSAPRKHTTPEASSHPPPPPPPPSDA